MRPLPPSLSHRSLTIKKVGKAPGIRKAELGALYTPNRKNRFFVRSGKKSPTIWNLSNSWPALAASWQPIFGFLYWGARPKEPGHNHSSSPFTTLADIAEHKVVSTGAGQPNYWPKTWFGTNAYNAISSGSELHCKSVQTFLPCYGVQWSPWRIKVYQSVPLLFDKKYQKMKQQVNAI